MSTGAVLRALSDALDEARPLDLAALDLPRDGVLAVLAPHPDDFDAIAASLRHFHRLGWRIHLAVLTTGASGVQDGYRGAYRDADKAALREEEQRASCAAFGLPEGDLHFLRLPEDERGHQRDDAANRRRVRDFLLAARPELVFMPHGDDSNVAHQRTWTMFRDVAEREGLACWAFLNRDAKTRAMRDDLHCFFDADEAAWKAGLLRFHDSQQSRNLASRGHGFDERVLAVNRESAMRAGREQAWAETFELQRFPRG